MASPAQVALRATNRPVDLDRLRLLAVNGTAGPPLTGSRFRRSMPCPTAAGKPFIAVRGPFQGRWKNLTE